MAKTVLPTVVAVHYRVNFLRGPGIRYSEEAATLDEAREIAARMDKEHGQYGRRACIYAVGADGRDQPLGGLRPARKDASDAE